MYLSHCYNHQNFFQKHYFRVTLYLFPFLQHPLYISFRVISLFKLQGYRIVMFYTQGQAMGANRFRRSKS